FAMGDRQTHIECCDWVNRFWRLVVANAWGWLQGIHRLSRSEGRERVARSTGQRGRASGVVGVVKPAAALVRSQTRVRPRLTSASEYAAPPFDIRLPPTDRRGK